jgi:hypothetical protein
MAMGLSYDRRVPEDLLKALAPGGFAHSLVELGGSGMWALDLQLRGLGEAKKQYRAALYVGTTKVLDLHLKGHSFALSAHPTFASPANGWDMAWAQRHDDSWFADRWAEVDNYLQVVIEKIVQQGTYVKEGMVQAAIGRFPSTDFTVIDREPTSSSYGPIKRAAKPTRSCTAWRDNAIESGFRAAAEFSSPRLSRCALSSHSTEEPLIAQKRNWPRYARS